MKAGPKQSLTVYKTIKAMMATKAAVEMKATGRRQLTIT
jgi:hypothetical protein